MLPDDVGGLCRSSLQTLPYATERGLELLIQAVSQADAHGSRIASASSFLISEYFADASPALDSPHDPQALAQVRPHHRVACNAAVKGGAEGGT